jgi:uncharacterized protein YndB with AHSA1/START domain
MTAADGRTFETTIEIDAPPDVVWKALSDAEDLTRWFPLQAGVTPGAGGAIRYSWGGAWEWRSQIRIWEPARRLGLVTEQQVPHDVAGQPLTAPPAPVEIAIEYQLEARGGKTVLRLVHSGFGRGAEWDDEFDGISHGWPVELWSLKVYLEKFRGRPRSVAWAHGKVEASFAEAWKRLASREGVGLDALPSGLRSGDRYQIKTASGDVFAGTALVVTPGRSFQGTADSLGGGLFRASTEHAAGEVSFHLWASAWGGDPGAMRALEGRFAALITSLAGRQATMMTASAA